MSNFRINYTHPWLLLLLIPAVVLTLWPHLRTPKKYRRTRNRIVSVTTHLSALVLAINLLAGLSFSYEKPNLDNELVILVDTSDSGTLSADEKLDFVQSIINITDGKYRVGVVKFGFGQVDTGELTLESDAVLENYLTMDNPDTTATDLASALKHARSLLKHPDGAKIVVVSDGIETDNTALSVIKAIAADGVKIDTAYFPNEEKDEVSIVSVETPKERIILGEYFRTTITVRSNFKEEQVALLRIYDNEELSFETPITVSGGEQDLEAAMSLIERGMHELRFEIVFPGDNVEQNNSYRAFINLEAFNNILILEHAEGESARLKALLADNYNVTDLSISEDIELIPRTVRELADFEQVILVNVAYSDMPAGFEEILNEYVYDLGGGLFTVGGPNDVVGNTQVPHAYNRNDIASSTYYKQMLPINAVDYTPPIAVMIVIDTSASMSGNKLPKAKEGAEACLDALHDRDFCGVISFAARATEEAQVLPVSQRDTIIETIRRVGGDDDDAHGGTIFSDAIMRAGRALSAIQNVERKHIILVTDGNPGDSFDLYKGYIEDNVKDGITMSVVTIDGDSSVMDNMEKTAALGEGAYHNVPESQIQELPNVMRDDLAIEAVAEIAWGEPFSVQIRDKNSAAVAGIDEALIPQLKGYYGTSIKKGAKTVLAGKYVPIYAEWQYGKGNVGSFMCDLSGIWSDDFMKDTVGQAIIFNIVNSIFPVEDVQANDFDYVLKTDNYNNQLTVHGIPEGATVDVSVTPLSEHLSSVIEDGITVSSLESNRRFNFIIKESGLYEIAIRLLDENSETVSEILLYRIFSYSEEYNTFTDREPIGEELMTLLAESGKGLAVTDPAEVFASFSKTIKKEYDPRILMLILAIVLVLIDIAVRKFKFKWPHELIRAYKQRRADEEQQ